MMPANMTDSNVLCIVTAEKDVETADEGDGTKVTTAKQPDGGDRTTYEFNHGPTSQDYIDLVKALEELKVGHVPDSHRGRLRGLLQQFTTIWDGYLGAIDTT